MADGFARPQYEQEQARIKILGVSQVGTLEDYITEFTRLSLMVPGMDEHTRTMLFVMGLKEHTRGSVLRDHPSTLTAAIRAAKMSGLTINDVTVQTTERPAGSGGRTFQEQDSLYGLRGAKLRKLTDEDRQQLLREGRCFLCRKKGHMARNCPKHPNADRQ